MLVTPSHGIQISGLKIFTPGVVLFVEKHERVLIFNYIYTAMFTIKHGTKSYLYAYL